MKRQPLELPAKQEALAEKHRKEAGERMGQQAAREYIWDTKRRVERKRRNGQVGG